MNRLDRIIELLHEEVKTLKEQLAEYNDTRVSSFFTNPNVDDPELKAFCHLRRDYVIANRRLANLSLAGKSKEELLHMLPTEVVTCHLEQIRIAGVPESLRSLPFYPEFEFSEPKVAGWQELTPSALLFQGLQHHDGRAIVIAAKKGLAEAQFMLALFLIKNECEFITSYSMKHQHKLSLAEQQSLQWLKKAADQGYQPAKLALAEHTMQQLEDSTSSHAEETADYLTQICQRNGFAPGLLLLAAHYKDQGNLERAGLFCHLAAEQGSEDAQEALSNGYENLAQTSEVDSEREAMLQQAEFWKQAAKRTAQLVSTFSDDDPQDVNPLAQVYWQLELLEGRVVVNANASSWEKITRVEGESDQVLPENQKQYSQLLMQAASLEEEPSMQRANLLLVPTDSENRTDAVKILIEHEFMRVFAETNSCAKAFATVANYYEELYPNAEPPAVGGGDWSPHYRCLIERRSYTTATEHAQRFKQVHKAIVAGVSLFAVGGNNHEKHAERGENPRQLPTA